MDNIQKNNSSSQNEKSTPPQSDSHISTPSDLVKKIMKYGALAVLAIGLPASLYAISQTQDLRQRASNESDIFIPSPTLTSTPTPTPSPTPIPQLLRLRPQ